MSDQIPASVEPVVTPPAVETPPAAEGLGIHPSWIKVFEDAAIPEMLQPKLAEKIKADDLAVKAQIEAARGTIDPQWQDFLNGAKAAGATPQELIASYNAAQELRRDPQKFHEDLSASIDQLVASGKLTRRQGAAAQQTVDAAAAAQLGEPAELQTPEAKRIAELSAQLEALQGTVTEQSQAQIDAAQAEQDQAYGDAFFAEIDTQMGADPILKNASVETQVAVASVANTMMNGDQTGTLQPKAAIAAAIRQLHAVRSLTAEAAAPAAAAALPAPVGGGGSAVPVAPAAGKFANQEAREAAMLAEAQRVLAES